jgi:hypothetical protein
MNIIFKKLTKLVNEHLRSTNLLKCVITKKQIKHFCVYVYINIYVNTMNIVNDYKYDQYS